MEKDFLRLIYQKRFRLMNRWSAEAMSLQPKFGGAGDPIFRSLIFRAFDDLLQQLRRQEKQENISEPSLLDQMNFQRLPDLPSYKQAWQIGGEVLEDFCKKDSACAKRFSAQEREAARARVREAIQAIMARETEAFHRLGKEEKSPSLYCVQCGRRLAADQASSSLN